jgi:hypothetical protein
MHYCSTKTAGHRAAKSARDPERDYSTTVARAGRSREPAAAHPSSRFIATLRLRANSFIDSLSRPRMQGNGLPWAPENRSRLASGEICSIFFAALEAALHLPHRSIIPAFGGIAAMEGGAAACCLLPRLAHGRATHAGPSTRHNRGTPARGLAQVVVTYGLLTRVATCPAWVLRHVDWPVLRRGVPHLAQGQRGWSRRRRQRSPGADRGSGSSHRLR